MGPPARSALILTVTLLAVGAARVAAQEPVQDTTAQDTARQDTVRQDSVRQDSAVQDTVRPAPVRRYEPAAFSLIVTVGTPGGGEIQDQPVLAVRRNLAGVALDTAVLSRAVTLQGEISARVSGEIGLGPAWSLRLGAGITTGTLEASYSGDADLFVISARAVESGRAELRALSVESALRYRIPSRRRLQPYLELGAAYSRWTADGSLPEAAALASNVHRFEARAGLGGVIPLTGSLSARIHVSTRAFRNPVALVPVGDTALASSALVLTARAPSRSTFADTRHETLSLVRLELGLSLDLGRRNAPPVRREEAPDTTSPPDRSPDRAP